MCSIAGSYDAKEVRKMLQLLKHRHPDGAGIFDNGKYAIGSGRLAIIDPQAEGMTPFFDNNLVIAFNGEIYNHVELRKELKKKYQFRTGTDTEVLAKAWLEWGDECLSRLNGMFAFAIYDGKKIWLARDIAGEKPLYFRRKPFAFASEAKALGWKCEEFPPAHVGFYDLLSGNIETWPYWELKKRNIDPRHAEGELWELLEDSIRLRTRSDVPYALYYSGGIDSSLIRTFHKFEHEFTYEDGDHAMEFFKTLGKIVWHLDYPISSFSPFGLWKLAEAASKKVKVVLSGEGADELFGGYIRYLPKHLYHVCKKEFPSYQGMFDPSESVTEAGWKDFNGNMRELLRMGDRMAAAFGIENRCPFLDKRIIEFAFSLQDEFKVRELKTKWILRRILERRNPRYRHIEKRGLFCDVNKWIGSEDGFGKKDYLAMQESIWRNFKK